jgi:toxin FitB
MILLDTNVISELMRPRPDRAVLSWIQSYPRAELWTSSIVIAELLSGIELMPAGRKQDMLRESVEGMIAEDFQGQVLAFNVAASRLYGKIQAARRRIGRPIKEMDGLIAAVALLHRGTLATRNTADFENCGVELVNPWGADR